MSLKETGFDLTAAVDMVSNDVLLPGDTSSSAVNDPAGDGAADRLSRRKILLGIPIVLGIALTWVGATQTGKSTFTPTFNGPFFTVWFSTAFMLLCFPVYALVERAVNGTPLRDVLRSSYSVLSSYSCSCGGRYATLENSSAPSANFRFFVVQSVVVVGPFCVLWMATNYCYLRALASIAPTDVTALFSSAPAFVYVFSRLFLKEPFVLARPVAVVLAIGGIVLFAYADGFEAATALGISLAVASAIGAGLYKTLFKRVVGDASIGQVSFFLSVLAGLSTALLWPIVIVLSFAGVEHLHGLPWTFLLPNALLSLLFNFLINFGIAFTYPLFISLGTVLGIPVNAVVDYIFRHISITPLKYASAAYILVAFFFMLLTAQASAHVVRGLKALFCCQWKRTKYDSELPS